MRILHLIQRYYPVRGGAEIHLQALSERLARDGHTVTVATTDVADIEGFWSAPYLRVENAEPVHGGVTVRRFPIQQPLFPHLSHRALRRALAECSRRGIGNVRFLRWLSRQSLGVPSLYRWLDSQGGAFDLVAAMGIGFDSLYVPALAYARRECVPFACYPLTHLGEPDSARSAAGAAPKLRDYYTMRQQVALLRECDAVFSQTPIESEYLEASGVRRERIVLAGAGVEPSEVTGGDVRRFRALIGTDDPIVLALGTQAGDKGTLHLIAAMERLWARDMDVRLVLAGKAHAEVEQYLARQSSTVRCHTHMLGIVSDETRRDALAACALLALPSRTDSFGIVLLEAWLNRKPVIGARAGGLSAVIADGQDGLLVEWGDVPALAAAIARLLASPALRTALGSAGRDKTLSRFTWDAIYPVIRDTYERLYDAQH